MRVSGKCPVQYFSRYEPQTELQATKLAKLSQIQDNFTLNKSYKGMAGIVDNLQRFNGYLDKGTSNGAIWVGVTIQPMKKFKDNFQILSTDYENYAILYTCTSRTAMYNQDDITILARNSPAFQAIDPEILNTIKSEFERLFGVDQANQEMSVGEKEQDVFKDTEDETGDVIQDSTEEAEKATEDGEFLKEKGTGAVAYYGQKSQAKTNRMPLQFDMELYEVVHEGCEDYPDLGMSLVERDKIRVQERTQGL